MKAQFIIAQEIQKVMNIRRSKSYQIVRNLGYITIAGKCPIQFFKQNFTDYSFKVTRNDF